MNGLSEAVIVCKGNVTDPGFSLYLAKVKENLQSLLDTDRKTFTVQKVEKWNSVKVTFHLPAEAGSKLRALAQANPQRLEGMGIKSVQVDGDQIISITMAPGASMSAAVMAAAVTGTDRAGGSSSVGGNGETDSGIESAPSNSGSTSDNNNCSASGHEQPSTSSSASSTAPDCVDTTTPSSAGNPNAAAMRKSTALGKLNNQQSPPSKSAFPHDPRQSFRVPNAVMQSSSNPSASVSAVSGPGINSMQPQPQPYFHPSIPGQVAAMSSTPSTMMNQNPAVQGQSIQHGQQKHFFGPNGHPPGQDPHHRHPFPVASQNFNMHAVRMAEPGGIHQQQIELHQQQQQFHPSMGSQPQQHIAHPQRSMNLPPGTPSSMASPMLSPTRTGGGQMAARHRPNDLHAQQHQLQQQQIYDGVPPQQIMLGDPGQTQEQQQQLARSEALLQHQQQQQMISMRPQSSTGGHSTDGAVPTAKPGTPKGSATNSNPMSGMEQMLSNRTMVSSSPLLVNLLRSSSPNSGAPNSSGGGGAMDTNADGSQYAMAESNPADNSLPTPNSTGVQISGHQIHPGTSPMGQPIVSQQVRMGYPQQHAPHPSQQHGHPPQEYFHPQHPYQGAMAGQTHPPGYGYPMNAGLPPGQEYMAPGMMPPMHPTPEPAPPPKKKKKKKKAEKEPTPQQTPAASMMGSGQIPHHMVPGEFPQPPAGYPNAHTVERPVRPGQPGGYPGPMDPAHQGWYQSDMQAQAHFDARRMGYRYRHPMPMGQGGPRPQYPMGSPQGMFPGHPTESGQQQQQQQHSQMQVEHAQHQQQQQHGQWNQQQTLSHGYPRNMGVEYVPSSSQGGGDPMDPRLQVSPGGSKSHGMNILPDQSPGGRGIKASPSPSVPATAEHIQSSIDAVLARTAAEAAGMNSNPTRQSLEMDGLSGTVLPQNSVPKQEFYSPGSVPVSIPTAHNRTASVDAGDGTSPANNDRQGSSSTQSQGQHLSMRRNSIPETPGSFCDESSNSPGGFGLNDMVVQHGSSRDDNSSFAHAAPDAANSPSRAPMAYQNRSTTREQNNPHFHIQPRENGVGPGNHFKTSPKLAWDTSKQNIEEAMEKLKHEKNEKKTESCNTSTPAFTTAPNDGSFRTGHFPRGFASAVTGPVGIHSISSSGYPPPSPGQGPKAPQPMTSSVGGGANPRNFNGTSNGNDASSHMNSASSITGSTMPAAIGPINGQRLERSSRNSPSPLNDLSGFSRRRFVTNRLLQEFDSGPDTPEISGDGAAVLIAPAVRPASPASRIMNLKRNLGRMPSAMNKSQINELLENNKSVLSAPENNNGTNCELESMILPRANGIRSSLLAASPTLPESLLDDEEHHSPVTGRSFKGKRLEGDTFEGLSVDQIEDSLLNDHTYLAPSTGSDEQQASAPELRLAVETQVSAENAATSRPSPSSRSVTSLSSFATRSSESSPVPAAGPTGNHSDLIAENTALSTTIGSITRRHKRKADLVQEVLKDELRNSMDMIGDIPTPSISGTSTPTDEVSRRATESRNSIGLERDDTENSLEPETDLAAPEKPKSNRDTISDSVVLDLTKLPPRKVHTRSSRREQDLPKPPTAKTSNTQDSPVPSTRSRSRSRVSESSTDSGAVKKTGNSRGGRAKRKR